jgi:hypothetical protein
LIPAINDLPTAEFQKDKATTIGYTVESLSFNLWFFLLVTFLSNFAGHLLYCKSDPQAERLRELSAHPRPRDEKGRRLLGGRKGPRHQDSGPPFPCANLKNVFVLSR